MKVLLVNHSDTLGGAAVVTYRLLLALRKAGVDARMLVFTKTGDDPFVAEVGPRFLRGMSFSMERLEIGLNNGMKRDGLFKVSTGHYAYGIERHPWVREADIICLNWINQGLMSIKDVQRLGRMGKKVVWTMHDLWAMTGICHHPYECDHYLGGCGNCQFLSGGGHRDDLSAKIWREKRKVYDSTDITFVAVSTWLAEKARNSSLLREARVETIPNAFPVDQYQTTSATYIKGVSPQDKPNIIVFGAARIDDPIKGLGYAIDALNYIFDNHPGVATKTLALFFGDLRESSRLDGLRLSHMHVGHINDPKILRHIYACSKVVLSTSLYETLPGTLIEGQAAGCTPVTFGQGGQHDIVEHKKTGYIARYRDAEDIARGILWAFEAGLNRQMLHETVRDHFAADVIAQRYVSLFGELTSS